MTPKKSPTTADVTLPSHTPKVEGGEGGELASPSQRAIVPCAAHYDCRECAAHLDACLDAAITHQKELRAELLNAAKAIIALEDESDAAAATISDESARIDALSRIVSRQIKAEEVLRSVIAKAEGRSL